MPVARSPNHPFCPGLCYFNTEKAQGKTRPSIAPHRDHGRRGARLAYRNPKQRWVRQCMSVVPALSLEAEDLGLSLVAWFNLLSKTKQNEPLATFLLFHSQRKRYLKSRNCITSTLVPCIERGALLCTHPLPSSLALTQIVLQGPVLQGPVSLRSLLEMQRQISQCCPHLKKFRGIQ